MKTAMQDLEDELKNKIKINSTIKIETVLGFIENYHKPLEKQQIIDAYWNGHNQTENSIHIAEKYFNETFEKK